MKIIGCENSINKINFKHKSTNLKFNCFINSTNYLNDFNRKLDINNDTSEIIFDDIYEIDSMIKMLKQFKKECMGYIGEWK